jgi:[ribosomal protein S18]-alanine N-acetyltransferase
MLVSDAIRVRPMVAADVPAVEAIERQGFVTPYPANTFIEQLALPHGRVTVAEVGLPDSPIVVGFCNYWLLAGELELLAIGSHQEYRRRGVAHALFAEMAQAAAAAQVSHAFLEVRAGNHAAIALYLKYGFVNVAVRRAYYRDGEDAVVMRATLPFANDGNIRT